MAADRPKLRNLSEIFRFLRRNETPIYVVMPTPFSLLGLDQWVGSMEFVNYFDIFEGQHPRCYIPPTAQAPEFKSMEDVANYLIDHDDFRARVKDRPRGKALFVMFDEETESSATTSGSTWRCRPSRCAIGSTPRSRPPGSATRRALRRRRT
jgi:hypothetical protein